MQNYAYDRNYNAYNRVSRYRYQARYSSASRTFCSACRVLAAVLLLIVGALVSDRAIAVYKGVAGCIAALVFVGVVGGIETGALPITLGFMIAFSALGFVIYKLAGKGIDL